MMKRTTFLAVLTLVIVVAIAIPAVAETKFTWSGEVTSVFQTDFTTASEALSAANLTVGVAINDIVGFNGVIFTTAPLSSTLDPQWALANGNAAYYATLNVGKLLGTDAKQFGQSLLVGSYAPVMVEYAVSGLALEDALDSAMTAGSIAVQSTTTISGNYNLLVAFDPASFASAPAYLFDIYGTMGPLSASVGYGSNKAVNADVQVAPKLPGDVGFAVDTQFGYDTAASTYALGFGGKVTYKTLLTVGAGSSYGSAGLGDLGLNINLAPATNYGADVWVKMHLNGTPLDTVGGFFDVSGWAKLDIATLRVGYVYTQATGGEYVAKLPNGGLYASFDVTF